MSANSSESWQLLSQALGYRSEESLIHSVFPDNSQHLSLLQGLRHAALACKDELHARGLDLHDKLEGLLQQLSAFEQISRCPVLAITGLLNAGKSSLLASYLSLAGQQRVLRGLQNDAGTHRFVLWLPTVWRDDPDLLQPLLGFLTALFGSPPEELSQDPAEAAVQYNARQSMAGRDNVHDAPLIAFDEALNSLRIGLLDCPDVQTGFLSKSTSQLGDDLAEQRRLQLARIGRLCSAFIVVSKLGTLHDERLLKVLSTLRDAMPGVPRLLAINKVKTRYSPQVVLEQSCSLVDRFAIQSVYVAYDFRSARAETRIPKYPSDMRVASDDPLPIFFRAKVEPSSASSESVEYLFELGEQLDCGSLSRASSRSLLQQLRREAMQSLQWLDQSQQVTFQTCEDAWGAIAKACLEFMAERDASGKQVGLRLQASPAIVAQMADSFQRTAPAWMRLGLSIDRTARQFQQAIANSASRFKILETASDSVAQFAKRFRRGEGAQVVTPAKLASAVRKADIQGAFEGLEEQELVARSDRAMRRFAEEDKTVLNEQELDAWSRQVWAGMSWKDKLWKGTQPLAVVMAPLLAAVLVPFDGGGSAVLVFASAKELLAAAGIAAVMTPMATGGEALKIVQRETPWRQLSDLFAIFCDALGVPRPEAEKLPSTQFLNQPRKLMVSNLEVKLTVDGSPTRFEPSVMTWEVDQQLLERIHYQLQLLGQEVDSSINGKEQLRG